MLSAHLRGRPQRARRQLAIVPTTRLGSWAVRLAVAAVVFVLAWKPTAPVGSPFGFACGLTAGIVALVAVFRRRERAVAVFAALVPFLFVVVFVLAELLVGHD